MLTHNFKNAIVQNLAINWQNGYDVAQNLYFVDMKGMQRRVHRTNTNYQSERRYLPLHNLFFGSVGVDEIHNRATKDYDNLDDMIASNEFFCYGGRQYITNVNANSGAGILILGSGDTPPTPDDYCLDSWIPTTDLKIAAYGAIRCKGYDDDIIGGLWGTYYNVTNENITVKEIGIMVGGFYYENNAYVYTKYLFAREVLENPVIIKPQEGCTFNFTIK